MKQDVKTRIEKLKQVINYHRYLYHVEDKQEISDPAFDSLKAELRNLENQYPELRTPDSPTQRVGGRPIDGFKKIRHGKPMLSIDDVFEPDEIVQWQKYLQRLESNDFEYFCEPKIDGFAISLIYEKGILQTAATRGDGFVGEDVTQNIKTIGSIPLKLEFRKNIDENIQSIVNSGKFEIRGEVYMDKKEFESINKNREKKYSNPRNLAAGSIRQLDPSVAASRKLKFLAYDIVTDIGPIAHSTVHEVLSGLGFRVESGQICTNTQEIVDYWNKVAKTRGNRPFLMDGIVILVNNSQIYEKLGVVGKSPRAIRAFKFKAKQAATRVKDIIIQVGRTGAVTPVAVLEPVKIDGAKITRATLHNEDEINRLDVRINDTVIIERAGDVIPSIERVVKDLRTGKEKKFDFPEKCPFCESDLVRKEGDVIWRCINEECPPRRENYLSHFVSRKAFNIEGLGPKIIEQLVDHGLITTPADFFKLKKEDLEDLERFGDKSANNLVSEIQDSKKIDFNRFIYSLGIRHIGEQTAIDLAKRFKNINALRSANLDELSYINDIGEISGKSIYDWFKTQANINFLNDLLKYVEIIELSSDDKLKGFSFVFTGTLETMSREHAQDIVRNLGGNVSGSVGPNTDYLVIGTNPGSKLEKAQKIGVKIIKEQEFKDVIN